MNIHLTKMGENEVIERFVEGTKKAADRIQQISKRRDDSWDKCAEQLRAMAVNGRKLFDERAMTPGETESFINNEAAKILQNIEHSNLSETDKQLIKNTVS